MLPNPYDLPASSSQLPEVPLISTPIVLDFLSPAGLELGPPSGELPAMPKVSINEDRQFSPIHDGIWSSRQRAIMLPEWDAASLELTENQELQPCILAPDLCHERAALFAAHDIRHT